MTPATPVRLSEEIAAGIRGAQLHLLPEVSHHASIEAPAQISDVLVKKFAALSRDNQGGKRDHQDGKFFEGVVFEPFGSDLTL